MQKVKSICSEFGCRERAIADGRCEKHPRPFKDLGTRPAYHKLYQSSLWKVLRDNVLNYYPVCVKCAKDGRVTSATVVDHMTPHRGDTKLFMDVNNLRSLCASCHSVKTAYEAMCRKTKKDPRSFYD